MDRVSYSPIPLKVCTSILVTYPHVPERLWFDMIWLKNCDAAAPLGTLVNSYAGTSCPAPKNADVRECPCVLEQASRYAIDGEVREFLLSEGGGELRLKSVHLQYLALTGGKGREDLRERSTRHSFDTVVIEDVVLRQTSESIQGG